MSSWLLPYSVGTASFTNGSKVVTGSLTAWADNAKPGDFLQGPDGLLYAISAAAITNTALELIDEYQGATAADQPYKIHRVSPGWGATSDVNVRVANLLDALKRLTLSSVSELTIGTGEQVFLVQSGFPISPGARLVAANPAAPENWMSGVVAAYEGMALTVDVDAVGGSGTFAEWNLNFSGIPGPQGPAGADGTDGTNGANGADGADGANGWTPELAIVEDGARRVAQVVGWAGGTGTPPASGEYVGPDGLVSDIAQAVDIRGAPGQDGTGTGTVTSVGTGTGLEGGPITGSGTISLADTAVTPSTYGGVSGSNLTIPSIVVDQQGRITGASQTAVNGVLTAADNLGSLSDKPAAFDAIKQSATEVSAGVAELATTAEAQAATDTARILTPAGHGAFHEACVLRRSADVAVTVGTPIPWNSEITDPSGMHDNVTNPSRITIQRAGVYLIAATMAVAENVASGLIVMVNGVTIASTREGNAGQTGCNHAIIYPLAAGDYVEVAPNATNGTLESDYSTFGVSRIA